MNTGLSRIAPLAQPGRPVEEEGVVGLTRELGDREGSGVRQPVAGSDHEALEGVLGIERQGLDADAGVRGRTRRRGAVGYDYDALQAAFERPQGPVEGRRVPALDPGPGGGGRRKVERPGLLRDRPQRRDPELEGGGRQAGANPLLHPFPDRGQVVVERVLGHGWRS